jgi:hypothetical protein
VYLRILVLTFLLGIGTSVLVCSQERLISGTISDAITEKVLPFATVAIKGTMIGTASNRDGIFVLNIPKQFEDSALFISYVGYQSYQSKLRDLGRNEIILLIQDEIMLDEIEVVPWSAWEYVQNAVSRIPENYFSEPFLTTSYYNEFITENDVFLKFTEGIIETYNPAYGDTARIASKLIQARRKDELGSIEFMRNRLEKRLLKEQKKALKRGEEWDEMSLDDAVLSATFGGPRMILRQDPIRDTASFLDPKYSKYYRYEIAGYTTYYSEKVIIIHFESRRKLQHRKRNGDIYISLDSDAIVSFDFESRIIIPDGVRPLLFLAGLGVTDPTLHAIMHYRPYNGRWYANDLSIDASSVLTDKNMFSKNQISTFNIFQSFVTNSIKQDNVSKIPKEEQLNNWKPLEEQVEEDTVFWDSYQSIRLEIKQKN